MDTVFLKGNIAYAYCNICKSLTTLYHIRHYSDTLMLCKKCFDIKKDSIYQCSECGKPSNDKYDFTIPFVNLQQITLVKLCSFECWNKEKKYSKECLGQTLTIVCRKCSNMCSDMKKCGQCKMTYYCSKECQKKDWPEHKKECSK